MPFKPSPLTLALAAALSLTLAACGGGGSSASESDSFTLPGTAATGAPYPQGSAVTVTDASGNTYSGTVQGAAGAYAVPVKKSAKAPFVVQVSAEDLPTLVSVSTDAQPARINVTPITNLIAATLSPSGNPQKLAEEIKASTATVTAQTLSAKKAVVMDNIVKPVTDALADSTDPISGTIDIGKGHDLVLEALKIQVQPTSSGTSTVSVTLKGSSPVDMAPIALGTGAASSLPKLAEASGYTAPLARDLAGDGLPGQIAALLGRMSDCYATPASTRIKSGGTSAADITTEVCKSLFLSSDPSLYRHNSYAVSSTGAFKGIFSSSPVAQSVKLVLPSFEYKVKNGNTTDTTKPMDGDVVFTAKWEDSEGNSGIEEHWARPDASGKLFLTGNLSGLDIEVSPRAELRDFPNLSGKNFYSTGYNLLVNAKHPYAKVVVTTPKGTQIALLKATGLDYFVIAKSGAATNTSVLRLAGSYLSASGAPRTDFESLIWAGEADTTDTDIAAFPLQSTWNFDLYTNANDSTPAVAGVKRRTLQRAPMLAELKAAAWPSLTAAARANLKLESAAKGYILNDGAEGPIIVAEGGDNGDQPSWEVPAGAWSPIKLTAYGRTADGSIVFNDSSNVKSSARLGKIFCSPSGAADTHCGTQAGNFAVNTRLGSVQFSGRDNRRVQMSYSLDFRNQ
jgi:hypothetical protein